MDISSLILKLRETKGLTPEDIASLKDDSIVYWCCPVYPYIISKLDYKSFSQHINNHPQDHYKSMKEAVKVRWQSLCVEYREKSNELNRVGNLMDEVAKERDVIFEKESNSP